MATAIRTNRPTTRSTDVGVEREPRVQHLTPTSGHQQQLDHGVNTLLICVIPMRISCGDEIIKTPTGEQQVLAESRVCVTCASGSTVHSEKTVWSVWRPPTTKTREIRRPYNSYHSFRTEVHSHAAHFAWTKKTLWRLLPCAW